MHIVRTYTYSLTTIYTLITKIVSCKYICTYCRYLFALSEVYHLFIFSWQKVHIKLKPSCWDLRWNAFILGKSVWSAAITSFVRKVLAWDLLSNFFACDRGAHQIEVVMLLFALKCLYPGRVFLVRGNHEFRSQSISMGPAGFRCLYIYMWTHTYDCKCITCLYTYAWL